MELMIDGLEDNKNVADDVDKLQTFMMVSDANKKASGKPRPPRVEFHWGAGPAILPAVIKSLNVTYTMFHPDGKPARATVSITLQEVSDKATKKAGQNPTSMGSAGIRDHRVVAGETLDMIAFRELGNAALWRHIAEMNNISNPFDLRPGQHLAIAEPS
jgi:nucleoid-associated protein YgaU